MAPPPLAGLDAKADAPPALKLNGKRGKQNSMTTHLKPRPLKVCSTCHHWSYKYKGLCSRLNQGVGKFWACEAWQAAADCAVPQAPRTGSGPTAP